MKTRRVLQIIVAVLSITVLACMAISAALLLIAEHLDFMPQEVVDFSNTIQNGLISIADEYTLYDAVVPAVAFGAPALLLLIAAILLLVKNNGKEAQNVVGCIFAFVGTLILTVFLMVSAKVLFDESFLIVAYCVSGGLLAVFVTLVACALFVRDRKQAVAATEVTEDTETVEQTETEVTETIQEVSFELEPTEEESETENEPVESVEQQEVAEQPETPAEPDTTATQYVPHPDVTIHDIVEKTYGKDDETLSATTLAKINKVRALYEANAISKQEYLKLVNKYLGH